MKKENFIIWRFLTLPGISPQKEAPGCWVQLENSRKYRENVCLCVPIVCVLVRRPLRLCYALLVFSLWRILSYFQDKQGGESEHINLKVLGQDNAVVQFKIKRHTPLRKLMNAYCDRAVSFVVEKIICGKFLRQISSSRVCPCKSSDSDSMAHQSMKTIHRRRLRWKKVIRSRSISNRLAAVLLSTKHSS